MEDQLGRGWYLIQSPLNIPEPQAMRERRMVSRKLRPNFSPRDLGLLPSNEMRLLHAVAGFQEIGSSVPEIEQVKHGQTSSAARFVPLRARGEHR